MVRRSNHPRTGAEQLTVFKLALAAALVVVLAPVLSACTASPEPPPSKVISLANDVLRGKNVLDVQRVDTDGDDQEEWVVFYRFDQVDNRGPVAALIYDVVLDSESLLPVVYPYKLRTPHENYLAQVQPEVTLVDIMQEPDGTTRKELLFKTPNELAFFRLNRDVANKPTDDPALYRCVGFFRSDGGVSFDSETLRVTVTSLTGFERSQLVTRHHYRPEADGYFVTDTTTLVSPFQSEVDFPAGIPSDILDTPYAEKIVLAFYQTLGRSVEGPQPSDYLSEQAAKEFEAGSLRYGSPFPLDQIQLAVVKELGYYPTQEESESAAVTVKVVFHPKAGQRSSLIEVRWTLIRVQNQWKMDYPQS